MYSTQRLTVNVYYFMYGWEQQQHKNTLHLNGVCSFAFASPRFACKAGLFQIYGWSYWSALRDPKKVLWERARKRKVLSYLKTGELINEALASNKRRRRPFFLAFSLSASLSYKHTNRQQNKIWNIEFGQHFCFIKRPKLISLQILNKCSWWKCCGQMRNYVQRRCLIKGFYATYVIYSHPKTRH